MMKYFVDVSGAAMGTILRGTKLHERRHKSNGLEFSSLQKSYRRPL
jgi:hypothetical protein